MKPRHVIQIQAATEAMHSSLALMLDVWGYLPLSTAEATPRAASLIITDCIVDAAVIADLRAWSDVPIICMMPRDYAGNTLPLVDLGVEVLFTGWAADVVILRETIKRLCARKRGSKPLYVMPARTEMRVM